MSPPEVKCTGCRHNITNEFLECFSCSSKYDLLCANVGIKRFNQMSQKSRREWKCPKCHSKQSKTDNTNTPLRQPPPLIQPGPSYGGNLDDSVCDDSNVTVKVRPGPHSQTEPFDDRYVTEDSLRRILNEELSTMIEDKIKKLVTVQLRSINDRMAEFGESIAYFNKQYEEMRADLQEKSAVIIGLQKNNEALQSSVKDLSHRLHLAEQSMRESNLEINGIPEHKSENLLTIIGQIAKTVDCQVQDEDIFHATRVAKLNKDGNRPRTVIVKLRSTRHRDAMLAAVVKFNRSNPKGKLSTQHIGMAGTPAPIFVAEHLTPANKSLHAATRLKAKKEDYKFVWVRNGRIYMRKDEFSPALFVRNLESLDSINTTRRS